MTDLVATIRTELPLWAGTQRRLRTETGQRIVLPEARGWRVTRLVDAWTGLDGRWGTRG